MPLSASFSFNVEFVCEITSFEIDAIDDQFYEVRQGQLILASLSTTIEPANCARPVTFSYSIDPAVVPIDDIVQLSNDELIIDASAIGYRNYDPIYTIAVNAEIAC